MRRMENTKKMYVTATEAAELLGVSNGYAYKIIRGLNDELKAKGYRTISGKVPTKYFEEVLRIDGSCVRRWFYAGNKRWEDVAQPVLL